MVKLRRAHLKVFSAVCANLVAAWFAAIFVTLDPLALTGNIVGVIMSLYMAVKAEQLLEEL